MEACQLPCVDEWEVELGLAAWADDAELVLLDDELVDVELVLELPAVELCEAVFEELSVVAVEPLAVVEPAEDETVALVAEAEACVLTANTPVSTAITPALTAPTVRRARWAG